MGVPLRRVNQVYVIVTSTKVDVKGVDVKKFDDAYFKKPPKDRSKSKSEEEFYAEATKKELPASYIADNQAVDAALEKAITGQMKDYMKSFFTLKSGDKPHA